MHPVLRLAAASLLPLALCACPGPATAPTPDAGCPAGQRTLTSGACAPDLTCADGFTPDPDGPGCLEVRAEACAPGTMPALGATTCRPVGWTSCPAGFLPADGGWGCAPVLPPTPCPAGTLERLGQATCVPLGDCDAPFPPADATLFVDDDGPAPDATHFRALPDALAAAPSGAVVAVHAGAYPVTTDLVIAKAVRVVGRCAAQVTVSRAGTATAGLIVNGGGRLTLSGVTLTGLDGAPMVQGGAQATLEDVDISHGRWLGATVSGNGSRLTLRRSRVADTRAASNNHLGWGLEADKGGALEVEDSVIERNLGNNLVVRDARSQGTFTRVLVRDGQQAPIEGVGVGLSAGFGATVTVKQGVFLRHRLRSVSLASAGTTFLCQECFLSGVADAPVPSGSHYFPTQVVAESGAMATLTSSRLENAHSLVTALSADTRVTVTDSVLADAVAEGRVGAVAADGATLTLTRTAVVRATALGVAVDNAAAELKDSLITSTQLDTDGLYGVGAQVENGGAALVEGSAVVDSIAVGLIVAGQAAGVPSQAQVRGSLVLGTRTGARGEAGHGVNVNSGAKLALSRVALVGNHEVGLSVAGGAATLEDVVVRGTARNGKDLFGHGILGVVDTVDTPFGSTLQLARVTVKDHPGVGLFASHVSATVTGSVFDRNAVALQAQDGTELEEVVTVPGAPAGQRLSVSKDTVFSGNGTVSGTGSLPLPAMVGGVTTTTP